MPGEQWGGPSQRFLEKMNKTSKSEQTKAKAFEERPEGIRTDSQGGALDKFQ
jgi:hypothetical protein